MPHNPRQGGTQRMPRFMGRENATSFSWRARGTSSSSNDGMESAGAGEWAELARELARPERRPVVVASHPRSGTHLLIDLLRRQFPACASWKYPLERMDRLYL